MSGAAEPSATVLVVDHRHTMGVGRPGETALDRCRSAAVDVVVARRRRSKPIGLVAVGDAGITEWAPPSASSAQYAKLEALLRRLAPTVPADPAELDPGRGDAPALVTERATAALRDDESPFAATLRAFAGSPTDYLHRIRRDQLHGATRFATRRIAGEGEVVLFTDDSSPAEVRTAVEAGLRGGDRVVANLAPRALFEPRGLAGAEATYHGYRAFDRLRRELDGRRDVEVHEVAPV